jgi:SAM-dependent methyltransferase
MSVELREYFKYLTLFRQDIREEMDLLEINQNSLRICDFGCGNGITTFGLALECLDSTCIGIDLFEEEVGVEPEDIRELLDITASQCRGGKYPYPELCELIHSNNVPRFLQRDIVCARNLPKSIDLAYCKKVLVNILKNHYEGPGSGEGNLIAALENIARNLNPEGLLCAIEYDPDHLLEKYFLKSGFQILKCTQIKRNEIRKRGRTDTVSTFTLYLCQKK